MKIIRILGGHLLVLTALVGLIELFFGDLFEDWLRIRNYSCSDELVHHQYCQGTIHRRFMAGADGGGAIDTHVNGSSLAVPTKRNREGQAGLDQYILVNIGDSFMLADELPFEKRLCSLMSESSGSSAPGWPLIRGAREHKELAAIPPTRTWRTSQRFRHDQRLSAELWVFKHSLLQIRPTR